ncbi:MAG: hypothetical protein HN833_03455 [Elusimicrobiaceae bacterium]|nr:hypothetical protein [Elusimicrobiaceae bacterium]MBT3955332.1 hypothetical protein [Elusimicrobiaceae bacterium]MBT4008468.1 hypothetical protein [Elusimicrobiaceae bacterium]MBT4403356.1 hypothetical protein [Elusimicrobiaceae bacterium]MBT4440197.1 hypothetical protein [Elusimicrobiaceae bacterium]
MKKLLTLILTIFILAGCMSNGYKNGDIDWIAMGPEFQKTRAENVEVVTERQHITKPWTHIGLIRIKNVSPDYASRDKAIVKARRYAADKGASAILIREVFVSGDEGGQNSFVLSAYAIKYKDDLQEEDKARYEEKEGTNVQINK